MPKANVYQGKRTARGNVVTVNGQYLNARLDIYAHSPTGFEWGYGGSGPAQLALAILAHEYGQQVAQNWYQDFKWAVVARFGHEWTLTSADIEGAIRALQAESAKWEPETETPAFESLRA